jgi:hypothetical protein
MHQKLNKNVVCTKIVIWYLLCTFVKFINFYFYYIIYIRAKTWEIQKTDEKRLLVFEKKILRRIFGPVNDNVTND